MSRLDAYTAHYIDTHERKSTRSNAAIAFAAFAKWARERGRDTDTLDTQALEEYRGALGRRHIANRTRNMHVSFIKGYAKWLARHGHANLTAEQISECLKLFPIEHKLPVALPRDKLMTLWLACNRNLTGKATQVLLCTGARHREALSVRPAHVSDAGLTLYGAKTRRERFVPAELLGSAMNLLTKLPLRWNRREWDEIREAAGLPGLRVKDLRSTFASYLVSSGLYAPFICASICGHTVAVAEQNYWTPVYGVTGTSILELYGLGDVDVVAAPERASQGRGTQAAVGRASAGNAGDTCRAIRPAAHYDPPLWPVAV
jgi:integrase